MVDGSSSNAAGASTAAPAPAGDSASLRRRKPEVEGAAPASSAAPSSSSPDGGGAASPPNGGGAGSSASPPKTKPKKVDGAAAVDYHFKLSSVITIVWFVVLTASMYVIVPSERIERLEGIERTAATLAAATLGVSCLSTIHRSFSGVIAAALVVQLCAVVTDGLMAAGPVPVLIDNVTGARVHMLRWCEFAPLAFLMTLLTEGGDMANDPEGDGIRTAYILAMTQGVSTTFGLIFPFMPGVKSWAFCLALSLILFSPLFFRLAAKMRNVRSMDPKGKTYRRSVLCLRLLVVEAVVWTLLVVGYLFANVLPAVVTGLPALRHPAITMLYDCAMDVIAKVIYMALIVNVHDAMFSQEGSAGGSSRSAMRGGGRDGLTAEELRAKEARRQLRKQKRAEKERREAAKAKKAAAAEVAAAKGETSKDQ